MQSGQEAGKDVAGAAEIRELVEHFVGQDVELCIKHVNFVLKIMNFALKGGAWHDYRRYFRVLSVPPLDNICVNSTTELCINLVRRRYKTAEGGRHDGWESGKRRRWADCRHEFAGFENAVTTRSQTEPGSGLIVWHYGAVNPTDIQQGLLGDCYLMAACASIALLPPEYLVHDLILDCSDVGLFGVKFYIAGRWLSVAIDDQFPCILTGGVLRPCFAQPSSDGAVWTMVIDNRIENHKRCINDGIPDEE